jgi:uncharacterized protein YjbJ (UPF0337 family)
MYRKNVAGQFLTFQLISTTDGSAITGVSPAVRRCIDGTFAAGGGTVTEDTGGYYKYAMSQADTNGNNIGFRFSGTGAITVALNIVTTAADPTDTVRFGLTALPNVASGNAGALLVDGTGTAAISNSSGKVLLQATQSGVTIPTVTTVTNQLTAAQIATGVWTDTTAGDFTTALSVGKSVMNGVSLGTGLTIASVSGAVGSVTGAVGSVTGNVGGNVTGSVGSVTGAVGSVTGNVGGNVTGSVGSVTGLTAATVHSDLDDIQARLPAALTSDGNIKADALRVNGSALAAARMQRAGASMVLGTCAALGTTTSVIASALAPTSAVNDQFNGRIIIFADDTTTTALRGQATDITDYVHATLTFTVTALTTAPQSGDTFVIV